MLSRRFRPVLLTLVVMGLGGCVDVDVQTAVTKTGSGTMSMKIGFTEGFVAILHKLQEIDPEQEVLESAKDVYFEEPSAEDKVAMKAAGLEIVEFEGERSDTKIYSRFKVAFDNLGSLAAIDRIRPDDSEPGDGPGQGMTLVKNEDGTYTLTMSGPGDDEEIDEVPEEGMDEGMDEGNEGDESAEDPEEAMKKAAAAMELMGQMMAEMANLKIAVGMEVPGEIVSFKPAEFAKKDGQKVTWTIDMAAAMGGGMSGTDNGFSVTFKMPEGESIPETALTK